MQEAEIRRIVVLSQSGRKKVHENPSHGKKAGCGVVLQSLL
jgi:hypothetical protein